MNASNQRAFYYHANASALGGALQQPINRIVSSQATISLPQAGGFGSSRIDRFHVDGLISITSAHVHVSGTEHVEHGSWRSIATARIEGLNVLDIVTADRIVSQVSVMQPYDDDDPVEVSLNGTQFINLRVNGYPVDPKFDKRILTGRTEAAQDQANDSNVTQSHAPTFGDLLQAAEEQYQEGASINKCLLDRFGKRFARTDPRTALEKKGSVLCSLVKKVEVEEPAKAYGHVILVPDFGNIFFGELLVTRFSAQLTMLRMEMGCLANGTISVGTAYSNGRTMP